MMGKKKKKYKRILKKCESTHPKQQMLKWKQNNINRIIKVETKVVDETQL